MITECRLGFFSDKDDNTPDEERALEINNTSLAGPFFTTKFEDEIASWLVDHPEGKVIILH